MRNSPLAAPPQGGFWGRQATSARDMPDKTSGSEAVVLPASDVGGGGRGGVPSSAAVGRGQWGVRVLFVTARIRCHGVESRASVAPRAASPTP